MKRVVWTLLWVFISAIVCSAQNITYLPHVADGYGSGFVWGTIVVVANTAASGTPAANVTITLTQDNGTAFNLPFADSSGNPVGSGNTINVQLPPGQSRFYFSNSYFSASMPATTTGYATVVSNLPVTAAAVFDEFNQATGQRIASAGVPPSFTQTSQTIFFSEGGTGKGDTAVAFVNPNGAAVNATLTLVDTAGSVLFPPVVVNIQGHNHVARFVSQLFPNSAHTSGTMQIQSPSGVAAIPLYFNGDGTFFTAPVIPIAP